MITPSLHQNVENLILLIYGSPQVMRRSIDVQENFVQMPFVTTSRQSFAQGVGARLTKFATPLPDRLIAYKNSASGKQFLNVPKTQTKTKVQPDRVADDLNRVTVTGVVIRSRVHFKFINQMAT